MENLAQHSKHSCCSIILIHLQHECNTWRQNTRDSVQVSGYSGWFFFRPGSKDPKWTARTESRRSTEATENDGD